jgi:hypothetical protein
VRNMLTYSVAGGKQMEFDGIFVVQDDLSLTWIAEEAGKDYHNRRLWAGDAPDLLELEIFAKNGKSLGKFMVRRYSIPGFDAERIKEAE